jgi:hypothetical protein
LVGCSEGCLKFGLVCLNEEGFELAKFRVRRDARLKRCFEARKG